MTPPGGVAAIDHQFSNAPNGSSIPSNGRFGDVMAVEEDMLTFELIPGVPVENTELGTTIGAGVLTYPWYVESPEAPKRPNMTLTLEVARAGCHGEQTIEVPVDAQGFAEHLDGEHHDVGIAPFAAPIPVPKGTEVRTLHVDSLDPDIPPTTLSASSHTPRINIRTPRPGEKLRGKLAPRGRAAGLARERPMWWRSGRRHQETGTATGHLC